MMKELEKHKFNFDKFINFRNSKGRTPFLCFCDGGHMVQTVNYFINSIWKKYTNSSRNRLSASGFEIDFDGNNGLHLLLKCAVVNMCDNVQFILETIFFPNNHKTNKNGMTALRQQNFAGDTPLHVALSIKDDNEHAADIVKLLLKYECNVATTYNKQGYLPIHVACINNNWKALAVLIQKRLYGEHSDDINLETRDKNEHTALEVSILSGYTKCVQVLCKNRNIYVDDMSFYNAINSKNSQILKCLLNSILNKHNIYDWKSFDETKSFTIEFLEQLMKFGNSNSENKCVTFLQHLIEKGLKKQDYVYIALSLNYNLSSIKLSDKNVPNVTIQVNVDDINAPDDIKIVSNNNSIDTIDDSKEEIIEPWIVKQELGTGAFGQVKFGINKYNKKDQVALKFISIVNIPTQFVLSEIAIVQKIDHSNVIMLKGFNLNVFDNGKTVLIAFEYAPYGELFDLLKYKKYFSFGLSYNCFKQIVSAIVACHGMNIIHRDLKPQNILIGNDFKIKVADFGLSKTLNENKNGTSEKYIVGTPGYMAPELFKENDITQDSDEKKDKNEFDKACDIFSLSIILWQMLNGYKSKPFNSCKRNDYVYTFIVNKDYTSFWNSPYHKDSIKFVENANNKFNNAKLIQKLFQQMFEFDPLKRIKAKDIGHHPWLTHMHAHKNLLGREYTHEGELQRLYFEKHVTNIQENDRKESIHSIGSLYSKETRNKSNDNSNNTLKIGYDSTQPLNESSVKISTYSEMMKQLNNQNSNINENNNDANSEHKSQVHKLLHKMSDNTSNFVKSQRNSLTNK